jgi:hypothetical protein
MHGNNTQLTVTKYMMGCFAKLHFTLQLGGLASRTEGGASEIHCWSVVINFFWQKRFSPIWTQLELIMRNSAVTYCNRDPYGRATNN